MIVKVCGVRTAEIAHVAVEAGASWIGLVFEERSPRFVDDRAAREVRAAVGGAADVVGVLVSADARRCDELADRHRLDAVQVHGTVSRDLAAACAVPVIRGLNVATAAAAFTDDWWPDGLLLLDATPPDADALPGGTGRVLPLDIAAEMARHRCIILAGGLGPDTVADAVAAVRPAGVDASSGLESSPGVKDAALVRAYVRSARGAFEVLEAAERAQAAHPAVAGR